MTGREAREGGREERKEGGRKRSVDAERVRKRQGGGEESKEGERGKEEGKKKKEGWSRVKSLPLHTFCRAFCAGG